MALTDLTLIRDFADVKTDEYDDTQLQELLDYSGSVYATAAMLWSIKAGRAWKKVSAASGNTRLELQQQFDHAKQMFDHYNTLAGGIGDEAMMESVTMATAWESEGSDGSEYQAPADWTPRYWWAGDVYS